ncbi:MAG TPA: prephenate dehydrogenase/arogenate dehydrogenase family protein [Holophaga sp.]|jgi:prephenate dehydrogenase|nr:prephenate dehydrogenase/arogenate dehydrogenase family protein [Holophaga sp.]
MSIAILGYGRFGRALGDLLTLSGMDYRAFDPVIEIPTGRGVATAEDAVRGAEWVVLAMPVPRMEASLQQIRPCLNASQTVIDVGSVKSGPCALMERILGSEIPHAGTHPLFGPLSLARAERPLRVVLSASPLHPDAAARTRALFEGLGCEILEQDPETHDRNMAQTHALAFFVAKGLLDVGVGEDTRVAPASFQGLKYILEAVRADAGHLFSAIQRENPFAAEAREQLVEALSSIHQRLAEDASSEEALREESIPELVPKDLQDLRGRSPELGEIRDLIDGVDHELVRLLKKRTELALRAAKAKAQVGAPVLDAAREKSLLQARREWAGELGLDADQVEELFRTLLRISRRAQAQES